MADDSLYHDGMRQLQDARDTRAIADRLEQVIVRFTATTNFPNCPQHIHGMQLTEHSEYAPQPEYTPPVPAWKSFDAFRDALPERDRTEETPK